jgi:hypothetical protein
LEKWQVDEMASRQNGKLTKWQVDVVTSWWNGKLMKWQVEQTQAGETDNWLNNVMENK